MNNRLGLDEYFRRWTVPEKIGWRRASTVRTGAKHSDQITDLRPWEIRIVGQSIERRAKASHHTGLFFR